MKRWWVLVGCLACPTAWAEYTVSIDPVDLGALTQEVKDLVPEMEGAHQDRAAGTVTFRRQTADFDPNERALLRQAVAAHDPARRQRSAVARRQEAASAKAKLKALGLTLAELDALGVR